MPIDSVLGPFDDVSCLPDSPYRSAMVRQMVAQTQCAGLIMSGNVKSFARQSYAQLYDGSTAYELFQIPWAIQNGFDSIDLNLVFQSTGE